MPDIELKQKGRFWPLHTEALVDLAASEIWNNPDEAVATQVFREWGTAGQGTVRLVLVGPDRILADAGLGTTLLRTPAGWEVLTDGEAAVRGIPVPPPVDTDAP